MASEISNVSSDPVSKLIKLLAEEGDRTSLEIAETLWLAMQMKPVVSAEPERSQQTTTLALGGFANDSIGGSPELSISKPPDSKPPDSKPPDSKSPPKGNIAVPMPQAGVLPPQALPIWVGDPAMLTDSLGIIQALKPLLQKVDAGLGHQLDESATVDFIARTQLCLPILEPEQEPRFDVIVMVDSGPSMHLWQRLVKDVVRILRCYGAFRDVRVFNLVVDTATETPDHKPAVRLVSHPQRSRHHPKELIDQRGDQLAILLSDCTASYWWDGTLLPALEHWGAVMPTVIWQMLPPWMWKRTALGRGTAVEMHSDHPEAANQRLQIQVIDRDEPEDRNQRFSLPVITSEMLDLERWSKMVVGDRRQMVPGFLFPQRGGTVPRSKSIEDIARDRTEQLREEHPNTTLEVAEDFYLQALSQIADERVQRFLELSSPEAQRLAMLLAAAPVITFPVVRLIRDAMLSDVRSPLPIAEVFLGGLLQRLPGQEDAVLEQAVEAATESKETSPAEHIQLEVQDLVQYDFIPKVREALLRTAPAVDTIEVINSVSAAVERRWNQAFKEDFRAFLTNPNANVPEGWTGLKSFASVTANILEQLGGHYASFARELRQGANQKIPLEDIEYEVAQFVDFPPLQSCTYQSATITAILDRFDFETAQVNRAQRIIRRPGVAWGYTEPLSRIADVTLEMIAIPAGTFMMGTPPREPGRNEDEQPHHRVSVASFFIGRYAVTQAQWRVVAGYARVHRDLDPDPARFKGEYRPVEQVSWEDAQEFCQRLSAHTGKPYRLPSEAEWEYACRAGTTTPFHYGHILTPAVANYNGNSTYNNSPKGEYRESTTEVGSFPANAFGLYDMHGNVWEWCEDDYHDSYAGAPEDGSTWVESDHPTKRRILRGGSWNFNPRDCRSAYRYYFPRNGRSGIIGFRVCCVLPGFSLSS